jgi:hydroxymethylpyrimidine pyrophosphatase-like HAD family hydrolase
MIRKDKYTQRLLDEWIMYDGIILGLDVDDTILPYRENFTDINKVIKLVKESVNSGAKIIIYTGSSKERYPEVLEYCNSVGIKVDKINENIITPFGDNRKIYANHYLDDRADLEGAMQILESALYQYRAYQQNEKSLIDVG